MLRTELILHLTNHDCYPLPEHDVPGVAQCWRNAINGHEAYVSYDDDLALNTWGMIIYELRIDPPLNNGHDSDYAVFTSFREVIMSDIRQRVVREKNN